MFSTSDLKWIKSVKREKGTSWAYIEYDLGDTFYLNFSKSPKWYPTNYNKAKPGDLLVLFQTLQPSKDFAGGTFVTHLVTPLDNILGNDPLSPDHPHTRLVAVIGVPKENSALDKNWSLFKANRGQICYVDTLESSRGEKTILQKQKYLFDLFKIDNNLSIEIESESELDEGLEEGAEKTLLKLHKFKERKPELIARAKLLAIQENRLFCEACNFNFEISYPEIGNGFIECHHRNPISTGGIRKTKIEDLALVCANCHRMLHRKSANGKYLLVEDLKKIILNLRDVH